jgi:hypothetical protein
MPPNEGLSLILARSKSGVMPEVLPHCGRPNNPKLLDQTLLDCAPKSKKGTLRRMKRCRGDNCRQSQQSQLELGLRLSD